MRVPVFGPVVLIPPTKAATVPRRRAEDRPRARITVYATSFLALACAAAYWPVGLLFPFARDVAGFGATAFAVLGIVVAATALYRSRDVAGFGSLGPLAIAAAAAAGVWMVPWRDVFIDMQWRKAGPQYERALGLAAAGKLEPNGEGIARLFPPFDVLSAGGEVMVRPTAEGQSMLFFTQGLTSRRPAGFLHAPGGALPRGTEKFIYATVVRRGAEWY